MTWTVLHILAGREEQIDTRLQDRGFDSYLPLCRQVSRQSRDSDPRPLWTGYILLNGHRSPWEAVRDVEGVHGVLCEPGSEWAPASLPEALVADLRAREDGGAIRLYSRHMPRFQNGQLVRFRDGSGRTFDPGRVLGEDEQGRIDGLFEIFGREVVVRGIEASKLEGVG